MGLINKIRDREAIPDKLCKEKTYQTSVEALKMIYYVIIGFAITEALSKTLLNREGDFLGTEIFRGGNLVSLILLNVFLFTIVRFIHGASIHLEMDKNVKTRWRLGDKNHLEVQV